MSGTTVLRAAIAATLICKAILILADDGEHWEGCCTIVHKKAQQSEFIAFRETLERIQA